MAPVTEATFRELLADCSRSAFAAFVADVWAARGRDVTRDGDRLVLPGDTELRPVVDLEGEPPTVDHGVLVVSADEPPPDAPEAVVGPAELRRVLLYDVPRDRAAELFERHFDRELSGDWPSAEPSGDSASGATTGAAAHDAATGTDVGETADEVQQTDDDPAPEDTTASTSPGARAAVAAARRKAPVLLGIAVVVLLAGLLVTAGLPGVAPQGAPATPTGEGRPAAEPTSTLPEEVHFAPADHTTSASTSPPRAGGYPPGVTAEGVESAWALGDAHATVVSGRSYELVVVYREYHEGTPLGSVRETVRVANRTAYVSDLSNVGSLVADPVAVSSAEHYADGHRQYVRRVEKSGPVYVATGVPVTDGGEDRFADRVETLLASRLSNGTSSVVGTYRRDGHTLRLVQFRTGDAVGSLLVDERGVVHQLRWRFTPENHPRITAEVTVRTRLGAVSVDPPGWLPEARNATGG